MVTQTLNLTEAFHCLARAKAPMSIWDSHMIIAPRMFAYIDRRGRPLVAILAASVVGLLAYLADYGNHSRVFDWLLAISGLSAILAWLAHIRMRRALVRRYSIANLPFRAQGGVWGSWVGIACNAFVFAAQVWVAISPVRR